MYKYLIILSLLFSTPAIAQVDTSSLARRDTSILAHRDTGAIVIHKDPRVDLLIRKQMEINEETTRDSRRTMPGFRIQVMNSPDRNKVFAAKTKIYQQFRQNQMFVTNQVRHYTFSWAPQSPGTYTLDLGLFGPNWKQGYRFDKGIATVTAK